MGNTCNSSKIKTPRSLLFDQKVETIPTNSYSEQFKYENSRQNPSKGINFSLPPKKIPNFTYDFIELENTMGFVNMVTNFKQNLLINDILIKPFQLKINSRASKYLPDVFSSQYERNFIRMFPYGKVIKGSISPLVQKKQIFLNFNKEILENASKISKTKNSKDQKEEKISRAVDSIKLKKGLTTNILRPKKEKSESLGKITTKKLFLNNKPKTQQVKTKPPMKKSQSISHSRHEKSGSLRVNLIPLIQKEKKDRANTYLLNKTKKKESISKHLNENNNYYQMFSYSETKKNNMSFKKIANLKFQPKSNRKQEITITHPSKEIIKVYGSSSDERESSFSEL